VIGTNRRDVEISKEKELKQDAKYCIKCGTKYHGEPNFCSKCGNKI
jgi:uncharacterized OB-fold protein